MIKAILACDDYGGVSRNGTLPWPDNSKDLNWFKDNTQGHIVVMGSTTWEDPHMPRPLPKRVNVLVTSRQDDYPGAHGYINGDVNAHLRSLEIESPDLITWVIGGPKIIEQCLDVIDQFYLSRIPGDFDCDTFLDLDEIYDNFKLVNSEEHPEVKFHILERRQ